ncbi:HlyD family efflux transporter periplasmic adaptor subunit [Scytonema sp. UIC 10036]|uniref:HlyD family secretion protein n=1 Tax=Scytonema sp. UIC 10036 TaxID=2304196 RepID=UPI0012DAABEA|nr:HlyD family efflux transporter periplasmic adaptor subunit [Scytonema sp. UIC 10036]MUG97504.1 HlyD family efflux transporter periplasmic adaptor subunit [Scytonema sp. UIC 10036]
MLSTENQKLFPSISSEELLPPVSPWTSLVGITLVGTVGAGISLASSVKYNVTVKAPANVRPVGEIRLVQPFIEGTIKNIFVQENQVVKRGDIIARIDDLELHVKNSQLRSSIQEGNLQITQIDAQISALDNQIKAEKKVIERTIASAKADLARNQREYKEQQIKTENELLAAEANLKKAESDLEKTKAALEFAKRERDRYQQLVDEGAVAEREVDQKRLSVEQAESSVKAEHESVDIARANVRKAMAAINPSQATVEIAQERIAQEAARGTASISAFLREKNALIQRRIEMRNQVRQTQKEIQKNNIKIEDSVIRATSDGTILKLNLRNPGQVLRLSEPVAEIVPQNAPLVIKAMVPVTEVKNVEVGQDVHLRIDACPYPDYGTLKGVVKSISPDVITPQSNPNGQGHAASTLSYFEATIQPEALSFGSSNHQCRIQAGMNTSADIISKEETAMQYLLRKARLITDL